MPIAPPKLPYELDALEPIISGATLKAHHGAHHRGYVKRLNALIRGTELEETPLDVIVRRSAQRVIADPSSEAIFNNAAQAWNHAFYWNSLRPRNHGVISQGALSERIAADFGGDRQFGEAFAAAALGVFGSGWVWLEVDDDGLRIRATANADTPIARGRTPLLTLDVWEHAYYLDHQSRRSDYVKGVVDQLLNWEFAERNFLHWANARDGNANGHDERRSTPCPATS